MSDLNDILEGKEPEPVEAAPEEPAQEPEAQEPEAEAEAEAQAEPSEPSEQPEPEAKTEEPAESPMVPASVVAELRRELRELKQGRQQQPPREPVKPPDVLDKPEDYARFMQEQTQFAVQNAKLDMSEEMARSAHGDNVVDEALEYFRANGNENVWREIISKRHPWGELVNWHKQQQVVQQIGSDPQKWMAEREAELREKIKAEMAAEQIKAAAGKPAPSLANATGRGGSQANADWSGPADLNDLLS